LDLNYYEPKLGKLIFNFVNIKTVFIFNPLLLELSKMLH